MNFTFDDYREIITLLNTNGYHIKTYSSKPSYGKEVILRHDIDMSIDKALDFAYFENSIGVKATYFVLITSSLYNVFKKENLNKLRKIQNLGHSIGLHFDETNYNAAGASDIENAVLNEKKILENILPGIEIETVSMHMPSKATLEANLDFNNLIINSYSDLYFKEYKYVSDSLMRWRENVREIISSNRYDKLHILTHPIWYDNKLKSKEEKIKSFLCSNKEKLFNEVKTIVPGIEEKICSSDF